MIKLTTEEFLSHFPNHVYQIYWDRGDDLSKARTIANYDEENFRHLNIEDHRAICFSVNGFNDGKRDGDHLRILNAAFADMDLAKQEKDNTPDEPVEGKRELTKKLLELPIQPNLLTVTRNGLHPYWLLENESIDSKNIETYTKVIEGIIEWSIEQGCKGDKVKDTARAMRLPNYYHVKAEPYLVEAYKIHDKKTTLQALKKQFPYFDYKIIQNDNAATKSETDLLKDIDIRDVVIKAYQKLGEPEIHFDDTGRIVLARGVTGGFQGKKENGQYIGTTSHDVPAGNKVTFVRKLFELSTNKEAFQWIVKEFNIQLPKIQRDDYQVPEITIPKFDSSGLVHAVLNPLPSTSFGYAGFDKVLEGIQPEFTYLVAAKSGNCKSALVLNILYNLASKNTPCAFFDLENGERLGYRRLLQIHTGWDKNILNRFANGQISKSLLETEAKKLENIPLFTFYSSDKLFDDGIRYESIAAAIREVVKAQGVKVVVVDNLRNLQVIGQDENSFLSKVLTVFDRLANELKIAIILVHHISIKADERGIKSEDFTANTQRDIIVPPLSKVLGTSDLVNKIKVGFTIALDPYKSKLYVWIQKNRDGESDKRFALNICLSNLCITDPPNYREPKITTESEDIPDYLQTTYQEEISI